MPGSLSEFIDLIRDYQGVVEVFALVFLTLVVAWVAGRVLDRVEARCAATSSVWDDAVVYAARRPLVWLVMLLGLTAAAEIAGSEAEVELFELIEPIRTIGIVFLVALFAWRAVYSIEERVISRDYSEHPVDPTTATALGKLVRLSILITAVITAAQSLGFSIAGLLAMGGVGGLAVGFAARDLLANFFGALMVYMDRPFAVGEWVRSPDREIEGTVEDIGWRLTRIRTFDQRPLYVPNSVFTSITVENPSRMHNRRIFENIGVRYADVHVLPAILEDIRTMLREHPEIADDRIQMVNFNGFGASSLDIMLYVFTKTTVWADFHAIKEDVLLRIAEIIDRHGGEVAFPTRTLHLESVPESLAPPATDAPPAEAPMLSERTGRGGRQ